MKLCFIIHDHDKTLNDFPLGVGYLISTLISNGINEKEIYVYNMDVYHYNDDQFLEYLKNNNFDIICIGMIAGYWQYRQLKRIISTINNLSKRPIIICGGHMFSPEPEFFMKKFNIDYIVNGEGEISFTNLIKNINNKNEIKKIHGISYLENNKIIITEQQHPIKDLDSIPFPAWSKFPIDAYVPKHRIPTSYSQRSMPVVTSRGCLYKCTFCYRLEKGYRKRSIENVIEECKLLIKDYNINAFCFRDELLMATPERALELAEKIIKEDLHINFDIDGRLNAVEKDVLDVLKKAGCVYINYGVESLDQDILDNMNKHQTIEEIINGIELTIKAGINPGLNVIFGFKGDNRDTAFKIVDFLKKYNTYGELRTIKPVTPYPGSPLYYQAIEMGLIKDCEDFYENKHINSDLLTCNFTDIDEKEVYEVLFDANKVLLKDYFDHLYKKSLRAHEKLYFEGDINFRGVRT